MIRERVIRVHVDDEALKFDNDEQIKEFQLALGKMASYGMRADINSGIEHTELFITETKEITGAFYPPVRWAPEGPVELHAPFAALNAAMDAFKLNQPYVIGAVLRGDGRYSFS